MILPAGAAETIGAAASIEKDVRGASDGREMRLKTGDPVYFEEVLTTGAGSRGKFTFVDRANLQMGPSSRVKLDSFVYAGASGVGFNVAKGAFRFVTAPGDHKGYEVRTPTATIGVRGTTFAVRAVAGRTDAVIYEGAIEVCPTAGGACRTLDAPCTFVTVTPSGITDPKTVGKKDWSFDATCKGAPPPPAGQRGEAPPASPPGSPAAPPEPLPPPSFSFGGPSIGFTGGTAIGDTHFADPVPMNGAAFMGGLKLGYGLMVLPNVYAGVETDAQYRTGIAGGTNGIGGYASGSRDGYVGTVRGKLGYVFLDRFMVYGTGGFAYGHVVAPKSWSGLNVIGPGYGAGVSQGNAFLPGVAFGGGLQVGLFAGLSVNVEYLYIHFQHSYPTFNTATASGAFNMGVCNISAMHGVRVGVNYGFSLGDLFANANYSSPLR